MLIEKYRPSYLFYLERAKKLRRYIRWNNVTLAENLKEYLDEKGIEVDEKGHSYLEKTCERFQKRIFDG